MTTLKLKCNGLWLKGGHQDFLSTSVNLIMPAACSVLSFFCRNNICPKYLPQVGWGGQCLTNLQIILLLSCWKYGFIINTREKGSQLKSWDKVVSKYKLYVVAWSLEVFHYRHLQLNLFKMATLGKEESGCWREVAFLEDCSIVEVRLQFSPLVELEV